MLTELNALLKLTYLYPEADIRSIAENVKQLIDLATTQEKTLFELQQELNVSRAANESLRKRLDSPT